MKKKTFALPRQRSARPISIKELEAEKIRTKYIDRKRWGKTQKDRDGGSHSRARERKMIPIRCTSSHNPGQSTERSADFWGRG